MRNNLPTSLALVLLCCQLLLIARSNANEPIPTGQDAVTQNDVIEFNLKFRVSFVDEYRKHTTDSERVQELAANFLHEYAYTAASHAERIDYQEVYALGVEAITAGSTDPLVELYAARTAIGMLGSEVGLPRMARVSERLRKSPYRRFHWMLCEQWRYNWSDQHQVNLEARAIQPTLIPAIVGSLQDKPGEEIDRRNVWGNLIYYLKGMSGKDLQRIRLACSKAKGADPWLTHMLAGIAEERTAWNTANMGKRVPPALDQRRRKAMRPAREHFLAAWKLYPQFPEAASHMISIAMLKADERAPRYWFDQAVAAQMDWDDAYDRMYLASSSRWGGSMAQVWKFGLECRDTKRFDTLVPGKMVKALNLIDREVGATGRSWAKPGVYDACLKMIAGYEIEYKRPKTLHTTLRDARFFRSMYAGIAVRAEQHEDARIWFEMLGAEFSEFYYAIVAPHNDWEIDRSRVYALTSPAREELLKFERFLAETTFQEPAEVAPAITRMETLIALASAPESGAYFHQMREQLQRRRDHFDNRWRELPFMGSTAKWEPRGYEWGKHWIPESSQVLAVAQSQPEQFMILRHPAPFPLPYMIEVRIESLDKPGKKTLTAPGILIDKQLWGVSPKGGDLMRRKIFMIDQPHNYYGAFNLPGRAELRTVELPKVNTLRVKLWSGHYAYYLNGALVEHQAQEDFQPRDYFSLANYPLQNGAHQVRFLNPRVKPLLYGPPPASEETEQKLAYYTQVVEADPDDGHAFYERAEALKKNEDLKAALRDFEMALKLGVGTDAVWVHHGLAETYAKQGEYAQELQHYRAALRLVRPAGHWIYQSNIAWLLATCPEEKIRDGEVAVKLATLAAASVPKKYRRNALGTLAAAHAEAGNFEQAIRWAKEAMKLTPKEKRPERQARLKLYEAHQPYREPPKREKSEKSPPAPE